MYEIISKICLKVGHVGVVRNTRTVVGETSKYKGLHNEVIDYPPFVGKDFNVFLCTKKMLYQKSLISFKKIKL
jgi:hypothetical protein